MIRYAITSRALYPGDEQEKQAAFLKEAFRWTKASNLFSFVRKIFLRQPWLP